MGEEVGASGWMLTPSSNGAARRHAAAEDRREIRNTHGVGWGAVEGLAQGHSAKKMLNWAIHNLGVWVQWF